MVTSWDGPTISHSFSVPFVKGKGRPRHGLNGNVYTPSTTRDAEDAIGYACKSCVGYSGPVPIDVPVCVEITVSKALQMSSPRCVEARRDLTKPDLDNVAKLVLDALNGVAYQDDKQVVELHCTRSWRTRRWRAHTDIVVSYPADWRLMHNEIRRERKAHG